MTLSRNRAVVSGWNVRSGLRRPYPVLELPYYQDPMKGLHGVISGIDAERDDVQSAVVFEECSVFRKASGGDNYAECGSADGIRPQSFEVEGEDPVEW